MLTILLCLNVQQGVKVVKIYYDNSQRLLTTKNNRRALLIEPPAYLFSLVNPFREDVTEFISLSVKAKNRVRIVCSPKTKKVKREG